MRNFQSKIAWISSLVLAISGLFLGHLNSSAKEFQPGLMFANNSSQLCYSFDPEACDPLCLQNVLENLGCVATIVESGTYCIEEGENCEDSNTILQQCEDMTAAGGCN